MEEDNSSIKKTRLLIEKMISEFYTGFSSDLYSGEDLGLPEDIETYISSIYEKNAKTLVSSLKNSIKDLDSIRSKYVPWEVVRDVGFFNKSLTKGSSFSSSDNKFFYESYENAFMRAMGMPESDDIISSGERYLFIPGNLSKEGKAIPTDNPKSMYQVLSERETADIRSAKISKNFYDASSMFGGSNILNNLSFEQISILGQLTKKYEEKYKSSQFKVSDEGVRDFEFESELTLSFVDDVKKSKLVGTKQEIIQYFEKEVLGIDISSNMLSAFDDIFYFSYLLFPPVQNSSISRCISSPKSIVKKPFEINGPKIVNLSEARESLLETIINIRLDKVSGLNFEKVSGVLLEKSVIKAVGNTNPNGDNDLTEGREVTFEDFVGQKSIIENIITNRLFKTLKFSCLEVADEIRNLIEEAADKGVSESGTQSKNFGDGAPKTQSEESDLKHVKLDFKDIALQNRTVESYESLKSINDSVLFILSQKENLTSFSDKNTKYSSLRSGVLFDAISASISFPGSYIDSKIKEINDSLKREEGSKEGLKGKSKKIDDLIGVYRGVGILDVLVFGLAMFLVGEDVLIGMLSLKGYLNLKSIKTSSSKDFFEAFEAQQGMIPGDLSSWKSVQAKALMTYSEKVAELYGYIKYKEFSN